MARAAKAKSLFAGLKCLLGLVLEGHSLLRFDCANHGHGETRQPVFHDVVGRSLPDRFDRALLADRSRHENEWRRRGARATQPQRIDAVESREVVVRENHIRMEVVQRRLKCVQRLDVLEGEFEPAATKLSKRQLHVGRSVFQHKNADRTLRHGFQG